MPRVSLLMSAYNREAFVAQAIKSVLAQTFRDFELLVWDDGSTDNTLAAAREAAGDDPRVHITAGEHVGVIRALNQLASRAQGEYVGWLDSDDALAPLALMETVAMLDASPDVGMVYTNYITMDEGGKQAGLGKRCSIPYSKERLLIDFMTFHFRLIRKRFTSTACTAIRSRPSAASNRSRLHNAPSSAPWRAAEWTRITSFTSKSSDGFNCGERSNNRRSLVLDVVENLLRLPRRFRVWIIVDDFLQLRPCGRIAARSDIAFAERKRAIGLIILADDRGGS
jgi:glycosyltransferase involved in cell wall biosynthesis